MHPTGDVQPETPKAGGAEQRLGADQPAGRRPARVTTIRKAIVIGVLFALVVGGASGVATARLTDHQSDLDKQRAEITRLASQVSQQEAQVAELTSQAGEGRDEVDRLNAELATLNGQVFNLEAANLSLEEQLSQYVNPAPGPTPTAHLTVNWIQRATEFSPYGQNKGWVVLNVTIENTSEGEVDIFYSGFQFTAKDDRQFVYPPVFPGGPYSCGAIDDGREKILEPPLAGGSLGPGEKAAGDMAFDLPEGGSALTTLVWTVGLPGLPEIAVHLPPPQVGPNC